MAAINFPSSPAELDEYTHEGRTYLFTGGVWISQSASVSPGDGDVMSPGVAVVSGNFAAFDGMTGTAIEDSGFNSDSFVVPADLGNSASRNVGTTAGTVAAGDDSRMSNARTPTAHASSHTDGTDDIQDATASQKGLATAAQITKLDGIEALADVTDAGNVGTAIHGATAKATLVDGDKFSIIDSEASNVLKTSAWSVIKAAIKTYYDSVSATLTNKTLTNPTVTNYVETVYAPSAGTAFTVDLANGTVQKLTSSGNLTITLPASASGKSFIIIVAYGGTHTLTWAGATIKWNGGSTPTATSVNAKFDIFTFFQDGTNTYGSVFGQNF